MPGHGCHGTSKSEISRIICNHEKGFIITYEEELERDFLHLMKLRLPLNVNVKITDVLIEDNKEWCL